MNEKYLVNSAILAPRMIVIGPDGEKLGEFLRKDAFELASNYDLDLVQVSTGDKPTCRIMDYGRLIYEQKKKDKQNMAKKTVETKGIRLTFQTATDYIDVKAKQAKQWLSDGNKVIIDIKVKGREAQHLDLFKAKALDFYQKLADLAEIESGPKYVGRSVQMILASKDSVKK